MRERIVIISDVYCRDEHAVQQGQRTLYRTEAVLDGLFPDVTRHLERRTGKIVNRRALTIDMQKNAF